MRGEVFDAGVDCTNACAAIFKCVIYDFTESRGGVHARAFLSTWSGKLVCDDYAGYTRRSSSAA